MLVRPHLEYAAPVWGPSTANNINMLEDTQKFALRICTRQWNMGYQAVEYGLSGLTRTNQLQLYSIKRNIN